MAKTTVPIELSSTPSIVDNGNATAITITSNEDIGLGTNSITNNTLGPTIYFGNGTSMITADSSSPRFWLGNNWYYNSGDKFIGTGYANLYSQQSGEHIFLTSSASGTADASVSFNTVMTINPSGKVGIGISPNSHLHIYESGSGNADLEIDNTQSGTSTIIAKQGSSAYGATAAGNAVFYTYDNDISIMADGGAGNTSSIKFATGGNVERMRLSSSGVLLLGSTSSASIPAGTIFPLGYRGREGTGGTQTNNFNIAWTGSVANLWIDTSNIGAISTSSDYRIKRNVETQTQPAIERVMQLRPVTYQPADYGDLFKASDDIKEGFIAHEVQEVIPSGAEGIKDDENQIQSLRVDAILAVAVKAIQELKTENDELKARITALEGN